MVSEYERPWWERQDIEALAGPDGLDPLDLDAAPTATTALYEPRVEAPQPSFTPIEPDYRWDMPAAFARLRAEIPSVPRSSGFFERMAGTFFDIAGEPIDMAMTALIWPAETTERIAGMFYWNEIPLGDRWAMGALTYEQFGFGKGAQREEILRRYRAGEDIGKIKEDFEGGISDLIGQLIADPLNLFGVPGLGLLANATDAAKVPGIASAFRKANKGLVLPRFSLRDATTADILAVTRGARPASNWLTRSLRQVGVNETADERMLNLLVTSVKKQRHWALNPEEAIGVTRDWALHSVAPGWNLTRLTSGSRAIESKRTGQELLQRVAGDFRLTHDDIVGLQDELIGGVMNGRLVTERPEWLLPGTMRDTMLPDLIARALGGVHPNPPQGLLLLDAARSEATAQGLDAARIFKESRRKPWFTGTLDEYNVLSPAEQKRLFPNREQWASKFFEEWGRFAEGDGKVGGAIDHYFGIGADVVHAADGGLVVTPRELTEREKYDRKLQAAQGHFKSVLSMAFLNKPAYPIANATTNATFGLMRIGKGVWRNNEEDMARIGEPLLRRFVYDVGRSGYQAIKEVEAQKPATFKSALKSSLLSRAPFANFANQSPYVGDIDLRFRIATETYMNTMSFGMVPEDLSEFGVLKAIRWPTGTTPEEQRAFLSRLTNLRNEEEHAQLGRELVDGTLSLDPAGYLLQKVLETGSMPQARAAYLRNLLGERHHRVLNSTLAASKSPTEARHAIDRVVGDLSEFANDFMRDVPLPIYRAPTAKLRRIRAQNSIVIRRWFEGLNAGLQRKADLHQAPNPRFEEELAELTSTLEGGQQRMFTRLDDELSPYNVANDVTTAEGRATYRAKRQGIVKEYYDLHTEAWKRADSEIKGLIKKPELRQWWTNFQGRRVKADKAVRDRLKQVFLSLGDDWTYLDEASEEWRAYFAYRDEVYQKLLDESYQGLGLRQLPTPMEPISEEGIDVAHQMQRYADETAEYLQKMGEHADDLFEPLRREMVDGVEQVAEWGPRRFVIDPQRGTELRRYLEEDVLPDLKVMQSAALRAGRAMADDALLAYDTRYGFDKTMTYLFPYGFWPSRMAHRWVKAFQARPAAGAAFAKLIDANREMQDDLPERLRGRLRIPVPFLPDWMGGSLYFDPVRYFFPPSVSIGQDIEGDTTFGTVYSWMSSVGAMPSPVASVPLQMSGLLGERDSYIRYFMSGGPWLVPGTSAQRGIVSLLRGAPTGDWENDLQPEDWDTIMLGEALPEPRIREILGIPPGEQWDGYRILRSLASGAATGDWTAEEAIRAMKQRSGRIWELGKARAEDEAGIRELSTWLGVPTSIYPKGERIQNGLQAMYAVARDMDRQWGTDDMVDAFYQSYPEFQARSAQRAWYRDVEAVEGEVDTNLFYIDLGKIQDEYDPQIEYLSRVRDSMPHGLRGQWSAQVNALYDQRAQKIAELDRTYPRRRTVPSVSAPPHERALRYLREQYYKIEGDSFETQQAAREMFLSKLTGQGMGRHFYRLARKRDELFAQFDQRLAAVSRADRDDIYAERTRSVEQLTQEAIPQISRQDFEDFLNRSKKEPDDEEVERQRASDLLTAVFSSSDGQRVLRDHPEIMDIYGPNPEPEAAGESDSWWSWYYALPPNSRARDDYVESYLPQLNEWRVRLGLPPLSPRERPEAGPIVTTDPYEQAIAAAAAAQVGQ